ncbi:MAG: M20/M25/M40 family metallo-hydrolase [Anaerolineae bacterium]
MPAYSIVRRVTGPVVTAAAIGAVVGVAWVTAAPSAGVRAVAVGPVGAAAADGPVSAAAADGLVTDAPVAVLTAAPAAAGVVIRQASAPGGSRPAAPGEPRPAATGEPRPAAPQQGSGVTMTAPDVVYAPGAIARHDVTFRSRFGEPETVHLELAGGAWPSEAPEVLEVPAMGTATAAVTVTIPLTVAARAVDVVELRVTSEADGATMKVLLTTRTGGRFGEDDFVDIGRYFGCRFDLDGSGRIDGGDVSEVAERFGARLGDERYDPALDFDHSGRIGAADVQAVARLGANGTWCRAAPRSDSRELRESITMAHLRGHLEALQAIADANGGNRAAGSGGNLASLGYVEGLLAGAGLTTTRQELPYPHFEVLSPPRLERLTPSAHEYGRSDFRLFGYSAPGDVSMEIQFVDAVIPPPDRVNTSTSACEQTDFDAFEAGRIALIQRGTCGFHAKARRAEVAGAAGVIIFNEGQPGGRDVFESQLSAPGITIPVFSASFEMAEELHDLVEAGSQVRLRMVSDTESEYRPTHNLLADIPSPWADAPGAGDGIVVLGAHLDSVKAGPGINDNGSGAAATLEIALRMAELGVRPHNTVRFAFWGAEELGLLGSDFYVENLSPDERGRHLLNLNLDMIASPNYGRFVYDGDGSLGTGSGPEGSAEIEYVLTRFFDDESLASAETPFSGRSDYGPFIVAGIPAGGLFTGTGEPKTVAEQEQFGGQAGQPYDSCYHKVCDTIDNIAWDVMLQHTHAAAHAVLSYALDNGFAYQSYGDTMTLGDEIQPDQGELDFWGPAPRR